jgi:hypothetical protein
MTTNKHDNANPEATNMKIGDDLVILKTIRRASVGGTWVIGTLNGHRFEALVFPEHAECPDYELGDSRISKIWLLQLSDKSCVTYFDRGWDVHPKTEIAQAIVDFLAAGLAEHIYHQ